VRREILDSSPSSVFDIACGENKSLVNLVKKREASTFVGNDISWSQIELVSGSFDADTFRNNQGIVFFTNHDGRRLPFADKAFDVGVCKNVLHHMPDRRSATALLRELKRVSKKALIVEVMDPKFEGGQWPRLRHSYYINFLKDAGGNFLSGDEFNSLIEEFSPRSRYDVRTIRGVYQFAIF
jgi:ubiquinone/menaquinone biosynthesis C-methylase UbiE